jgi:MFS transporter, DHA2 family, methylenomycin A resistance protein
MPAPERALSRQIVLVAMCAGYFLVLLDVTIVNVALPSIARGLHAGVSDLQWTVDGYAIALASLMLGGGTVGDVYGHRRIVIAGFGLFGTASVGCGLAPTVGALISCRVLQGAGAALMLPGTLAVIANAFPEAPDRARAIGTWAAIGGAALPAGPLLGGALTQLVNWRAVFFVNVPIVLVALVVTVRTVHESTGQRSRRPDPPGIALGAGLLALVTFAFIQAGHAGFGTPVVVALIGATGCGAALFAVERSRRDPMLPLRLFRKPAFTAPNLIAGAMNLSTLGLLFVLTLYLQDVRRDSALVAGLALLPLFLPVTVVAPLIGRITGRSGPRRPMIAGPLLAAAGVGLLGLVSAHSSYLVLVPGLLLWGTGIGALTPAVVAAAIGAVPTDRAGLASGVNNTARQAGGAIGIAAFGALAGEPAMPRFTAGFHAAAFIAAGLFLASALTTAALIPAGLRHDADT